MSDPYDVMLLSTASNIHMNVLCSKLAVSSMCREATVNEDLSSILITINVPSGVVCLNVLFSNEKPFPLSPPVIVLEFGFKAPFCSLNIFYSCHPFLLKSKWTPETDLHKIIEVYYVNSF